MTIILVGDSGSGKSTIENYFVSNLGYTKIVSYTTRQPRDGEISGKDYWFINNEEFDELMKTGVLAEHEEYSQGRFYGTAKSDYTSGNKIVVLTPNGFHQLKRNLALSQDILTIYVETSLGNRIIRYIKRCGVDKFTFDDKNEICSRVERDFGMFLGIKDEVDLVVDGNEDISVIASKIIDEIDKRETAKEDAKWS